MTITLPRQRCKSPLPAADAIGVGTTFVDGRACWLFSDGRTLPIIAGGAPEGDPPAGDGGAPGPAGGDKTFTQDDLTRVSASENSKGHREGKKAGQRELLTALGFDPETTKPEDVKGILDAARAAQDAAKDQATRDREAAAEEKRQAAAERAEVARERHAVRVERALVAAGLPADDVEDIALLVKADQGADVDTVKAAVEDLKTRRPALFTTGAPALDQLPGGDPGTPGRGAGNGTGKSGVAKGKELAADLGWVKQPA